MGTMTWKQVLKLFLLPAVLTIISLLSILSGLHVVSNQWPYLQRAWAFAWLVSLVNFLNLLPFGYSGYKIFRNKWISYVSFVAFIFATEMWILGAIVAVIYIAVRILRKCRNSNIPAKPKVVHILVATVIYLLFLAIACQMLALSALKYGRSQVIIANGQGVGIADYGLVDVRGQIHIHSNLSHDCDHPVSRVAEAANKTGVRWIILTDHVKELPPGNYPDWVNGTLFIYGNERNWREKSSKFQASLKDDIPSLKMHGHLEDVEGLGDEKWDAIELMNFHGNLIALEQKRKLFGKLVADPKNVYKWLAVCLPQNLDYWQKLAEREQMPIPIFGTPDSHHNIRILWTYVDEYELMMSLVSTHIWLNEGEELSQESVFRAIKSGRTYIAFDYLADPTGLFQFFADDDFGNRYFTGDKVENCLRLVVRNDLRSEMRIYRNNNLYKIFEDVDEAEIENPEPGFWRAELYRKGSLWIVSGQIMVK